MYGNFQENRFLLDLIKKQRASNILDVGCATGTTYRLLLNKIGRGKFQYYGIDMSEPAVEKAKSLYTQKTSFLSRLKNITVNFRQKRDR